MTDGSIAGMDSWTLKQIDTEWRGNGSKIGQKSNNKWVDSGQEEENRRTGELGNTGTGSTGQKPQK